MICKGECLLKERECGIKGEPNKDLGALVTRRAII